MAILFIANLTLLLPNANPVRVVGALLLVGLLPGLSWGYRFFSKESNLHGGVIASALSFSFTSLITLLLHYLPGPVHTWQILVALNLAAILPIILPRPKISKSPPFSLRQSLAPLLLILLIALFLRSANLHYSEFQGDESLAMIAAAEALEGHEDALFLRSKGPGEILLPMAMWRLTGTINEAIARLPFTLAALMAIVTIYLVGNEIGGNRLGWLAAGFFAMNGFMVAFGRIVQYQALVVWMSAMAFLLLLLWQKTHRHRFAFLGGVTLGTGLLAHYDAVLVLPALGWLLLAKPLTKLINGKAALAAGRQSVGGSLLFIIAVLLSALPFYLPFILDPQANRTGDYVGGRIGNELRNNLPDFFHFNTFYSSSIYIILTGLLVLGFWVWVLWQAGWTSQLIAIVGSLAIVAIVFNPALLQSTLDLSVLPFAVTLLAAFLALFGIDVQSRLNISSSQASYWQAGLVWFAVPFSGYNFVVALGLTHIYTIVPAWALLAALGWQKAEETITWQAAIGQWQFKLTNALLVGVMLLSTLFLWNAFVRHDVEYWQDYPDGNLAFYWTPYTEPPTAGFFGFAHRAGWKSVGQKITNGELSGDYGSNEEPDVTTWYTRGAPRACDPQPEFYFLADDLIDPVALPGDIIDTHYKKAGDVNLPNQKQLQIMQQTPTTLNLGELNDSILSARFDAGATPAAFARSARGSLPANANFSNRVQLIGYDLDTRRAYPGGRLPVTLYWQVLDSIEESYQVFTHLEGDTGPAAQSDGVPVCWSYPTDTWRPGQIIADQHAITLSPNVSPGHYPLKIGLYLPDTFARLDVLDEAGNPAGTSVTLTTIEIKTK